MIGPHHPVMESIGRRTLELFLDLHERSGHAFAFDREPHGCLILSPEGGDPMTPAELRAAEPLLAPHVEYAELNLDARRIDPGAAAATLADDARTAGAEIRTGCAVRELLRSGDHVTGVLTDDGRIEAEHVVVAAGPWSWRVCRTLPHDVPVRGVRGWILVTRPAPFRLRHAIEEEWTRPAPPAPTLAQLAEGTEPEPYVACVLQQDFAGRVLIGSSLHGATSDADESPETLTAIAKRAVALMPALAGLPIAERRSCQRPFSPDLLPLLGPYPGVRRTGARHRSRIGRSDTEPRERRGRGRWHHTWGMGTALLPRACLTGFQTAGRARRRRRGDGVRSALRSSAPGSGAGSRS